MDRDKIRTRLEQLRAELDEQERMGEADRAPVELDQTSVGRLSRIDAMQVQSMALAAEQRRKLERQRVMSALGRIDSEDFGYCDLCGEPIAPPRLEQNPTVTRCIRCAA